MKEKSQAPSNQDIIIALIRELSGQQNTLIIPRIFIRMTGSVNSALLLSQIIYWSDKSTIPGFKRNLLFAKTSPAFEEELGLGHKAFENARQKLESLGLISTKSGGFAGKKSLIWHPEMNAISQNIQTTISAQESNASNDEIDYESIISDFFNENVKAIHPKRINGSVQKVQKNKSQQSIGKCSEERFESVHNVQDDLAVTPTSNTEPTAELTQHTTIKQNLLKDIRGVGGSSTESISGEEMIHSEVFIEECTRHIKGIDSDIDMDFCERLIEKLFSAFQEIKGLSQKHINLILTFSLLTGYSDFTKTDQKNGVTRTKVERWIEPIRLWERNEVTADDIKTAILEAKRDGMHSRLICPVSYSPRVMKAHKEMPATTSQYDDEL